MIWALLRVATGDLSCVGTGETIQWAGTSLGVSGAHENGLKPWLPGNAAVVEKGPQSAQRASETTPGSHTHIHIETVFSGQGAWTSPAWK